MCLDAQWASRPACLSGLPYTPKKDAVHEITYLAHDVGHFTVPDLIFTGKASPNARRTYIAWRLMSEAVTMTMADMVRNQCLNRWYPFGVSRVCVIVRVVRVALACAGVRG